MNLLDHPLIRTYFGCNHPQGTTYCGDHCKERISVRVLRSMQEPIKKGERCLELFNEGEVKEIVLHPITVVAYHPMFLRLPDRFQKQKIEVLKCCHGFPICIHCQDKPKPSPEKCRFNRGTGSECNCQPKDAVEEKINEVSRRWSVPPYVALAYELRELVRLVRETK